jgi:hypothetical protein
MLLICIHSYLKSFLRYDFLIWVSVIQKLHIYMSKDVWICGYFLKLKGVCQQKRLGNPVLGCYTVSLGKK